MLGKYNDTTFYNSVTERGFSYKDITREVEEIKIMKKIWKKLACFIVLLAAAFLYYYITLPAINIHSVGFWWFILVLVLALAALVAIRRLKKSGSIRVGRNGIDFRSGSIGIAKYLFWLAGILFVVFVAGGILSSPIVNAKKYQALMDVKECNFVEDIQEVDFNTIPLLDRDSASILGNRKMGSMVDMVSQFEVAEDYTQINYKGTPVRVTPLTYASPIKWLTNHKNGIPAYIRIDMTTQNTECVKLEQGIHYSESEYFNHYINRHLRFRYPTYIFSEQLFFEIDDDGVPYWVCPVKKYSIGLFGGQTVGRVVLCNAITGECEDYAIDEVPQWIDKAYQAELLMALYDYHGTLKHGFFNSVLGQRDCLQTTNGYNYIAMDDDVWVYSGVTSVSGDQSNVGFVLMNQRTMETRFYKVEGATEESAMSSAEGQVQNLKYTATFPLLLNISNEPTYFMALKDDAGLVKKYAMVNIQKYQWVAIGDTVKDCKKAYNALLSTNGIKATDTSGAKEAKGKITSCTQVVIEGNSHIYLTVQGYDDIFDVDLTNEELIRAVTWKEEDAVRFSYLEGDILSAVTALQ